jgi:glucan endo-1,3-alpha-glucosidase
VNGGGVEVAASDCNMNCAGKYSFGPNQMNTLTNICAGNSQQKCGAGFRITLYSKTPTANPIPLGWIKNFCTVDQDARVLSGYSFDDNSGMTPASCIAICAQRNFILGQFLPDVRAVVSDYLRTAGVENGNECYCGNTVNQALPTKDADCKTACAGDNAQYCGGGWRLMVYIKVDTSSTVLKPLCHCMR